MLDAGFVAHCHELLAPLGAVRTTRMFGGVGLYVDDVFIALIADDRLYLKTDERTRQAFVDAGAEAFAFSARGKTVTTSYFTPPDEALDSAAAMTPWARLALQAGLAARAAAAPRAARKRRRPNPR